jgi:3-phenylpropionate/cinnamic acid dioxygenase small subunit
VRYGDPVYNEIAEFLIEEARLLDHDLLDEWTEALAEDLRYTMPVRRTVLRRDGQGFDPKMGHFDDDLASIKIRVRRVLHTDSAYAEDPPSRVRRFVSNITVHETDTAGEYAVTSYLLALRNRWDAPNYDTISAAREDLLRRRDDRWELARRRILIDQALLGTPNLAIFL